MLQRQESGTSSPTPESLSGAAAARKSVIWDSLWSLDYSYESARKVNNDNSRTS